MRPLEILTPILLTLYLLWPLTGRVRPPAVGVLPAFTLVVLITHGRVEGLRWQMYPLYGIAIVLFLMSLTAFMREGKLEASAAPKPQLLPILLSLLLLAVSTAIPILLPVPTVPPPTGPYSVGTHTYVLTDQGRKEIFSGKDEPRKFMIQVWYPALPPDLGTPPAPWMDNAEIIAPAIAEYINLPTYFLDHLSLAKTSAYQSIPPAPGDGPYPVLLFSHGWNGFRAQSTFLMQDLASHGYVVVSLEHTYGSRMAVFPDGQVAPNNPNALPPGDLPALEYEEKANILVTQWTQDIGYALDYLSGLNQNDPSGLLTGLLDLEKVGNFGHSTGGGAVLQFCASDPRCKVGLTLDAFVRPVSKSVLANGTSQPFFYMFSEYWPFERNTKLFEEYYSHVQADNRIVTILGSDHYDFSDLPALTPLAPKMGLKGPINGPRVQKIIQDYVLAFFDREFKGLPAPLLDGPSPEYPEVIFGP